MIIAKKGSADLPPRRSALFPYMTCQCRLLYCRLRPRSSNVRFSSFCTYTTVPSSTKDCASTITSASVSRVSSPAFANGSCTSTDSASEIHPVFHHTLPQHACANAQVSSFFMDIAVRNPTQREIFLGGHFLIMYPPKSITAGIIRFTIKISMYSSICSSFPGLAPHTSASFRLYFILSRLFVNLSFCTALQSQANAGSSTAVSARTAFYTSASPKALRTSSESRPEIFLPVTCSTSFSSFFARSMIKS